MPVPYPITSFSTRACLRSLYDRLYAHGLTMGAVNDPATQWQHLLHDIERHQGVWCYVWLDPRGPEASFFLADSVETASETAEAPLALVNSPEHLIAYARRHGLLPIP